MRMAVAVFVVAIAVVCLGLLGVVIKSSTSGGNSSHFVGILGTMMGLISGLVQVITLILHSSMVTFTNR